jgi:uncharacterized protein YbjT (DUF2867 family)
MWDPTTEWAGYRGLGNITRPNGRVFFPNPRACGSGPADWRRASDHTDGVPRGGAPTGSGGVTFWAGDLADGSGVQAAAAGADTIVHCAGSAKGDDRKTANLLRALGEPAGLVPDLAGPRVYGLDELVRGYLRATGRRRPIVRFRMPGGAYRAMRAGANLDPGRAVGRRTWEDFLADHLATDRAGTGTRLSRWRRRPPGGRR